MANYFNACLSHIEDALDHIEAPEAVQEILAILDAPPMELQAITHIRLYAETLPKAEEYPLTPALRHLHFLWDTFDKLPLCLVVSFSIPFRRLLARRLFGACGAAFTAEENLRFNFPQLLSVGDNVFFNRNVFLDTKGGVRIGNDVAVAEDVRVFTHSHDEASHITRSYKPVVIGDYAKVYSGAVLLPGVTVGRQAIVAAGALVTHDVPDNMVAAGRPATILRERRTEGHDGAGLDHIWLF
ncbi:acyltransferase [Solidesulfovibrio sp. C21]|uniref:acyltransferase n=1 Tax=Solidesulfovibrio sp. C21 TaxID=3398613 RepID=UPI0039FCC35B